MAKSLTGGSLLNEANQKFPVPIIKPGIEPPPMVTVDRSAHSTIFLYDDWRSLVRRVDHSVALRIWNFFGVSAAFLPEVSPTLIGNRAATTIEPAESCRKALLNRLML